ncbi:MAG: tRNA pseudouridine(55) synthase TruB [Desulfamplus sp.]|nr:tRNA pseudouridine(55) synthase TruB [Desulfamplus sp.]
MKQDGVIVKDGIIAIDKPEGISSAAVVAKIKRKLDIKKVGHTGTLDPFATGLMLCGVNKGTKLSQFFLGSDKSYIAEILLGIETDTQDYTGQVINRCDPLILNSIDNDKIIEEVEKFKGIQMQTPPVYSALKHNGVPLYKLARLGQAIEKPSRKIEIYSIKIESIHSIDILKANKIISGLKCLKNELQCLENKISQSEILDSILVTISVDCSSGTYIRSLAHDIGKKLGCGACLSALRRTETSGFSIENSVSLTEFQEMSQEDAFSRIIPMAEALKFMPVIHADDNMIETVRFGRVFTPNFQPHYHFSNSDSSDNYTDSMVLTSSNANEVEKAAVNGCLYLKVIDSIGRLAAIVKYNANLNKYDYCCVFVN